MAGRPRSFDREQALGVALDSFWRHGYAETSIAQLTETIGITPPSLYAAFGDKRTLFGEAADRYIANFRAGVAESLDAPTAREAVQRLLAAAVRAHTDPGTPPGCLVLSEPSLAAEREHLRASIAERIARGQRDGDVPAAVDPAQMADYLETVMGGMSARAREDGAGREQLAATARLALAAMPGPASAGG